MKYFQAPLTRDSIKRDWEACFKERAGWETATATVTDRSVRVEGRRGNDTYTLSLRFVPSATGVVVCHEVYGQVRPFIDLEEHLNMCEFFQKGLAK
jgi:hypothetical protein